MPDTFHYYIDSPGLDPEHPHTNRDDDLVVIVDPDTEAACFLILTDEKTATLITPSPRFTPKRQRFDPADEKAVCTAVVKILEDDHALTLDDFRTQYPRLVKLRW